MVDLRDWFEPVPICSPVSTFFHEIHGGIGFAWCLAGCTELFFDDNMVVLILTLMARPGRGAQITVQHTRRSENDKRYRQTSNGSYRTNTSRQGLYSNPPSLAPLSFTWCGILTHQHPKQKPASWLERVEYVGQKSNAMQYWLHLPKIGSAPQKTHSFRPSKQGVTLITSVSVFHSRS